ncbi:MAG: heme ABC exporter ATP-binding protein CcmA [Caulobacterales bacterium]
MITALAIHDLTLRRGDRLLFQGLSLRVEAGEAVALTGANGAGKTSLLRAVAGFIAPTAGRIGFEGSPGALQADEARRADIHLVGHQDALKSGRTVVEELDFQIGWTGAEKGRLARSMQAMGLAFALAALDLERLERLEIRKLSAGQRRRVALARLVGSPRPLWLLDEPMAPLDAAHRQGFGELMREHLRNGGLILAAVHDPLPIPARIVEIGA